MEGMTEIMVSAATGVMNSLLAKLTILLDDECKLPKGVKREICFLRHEMRLMNGVLRCLAEMEELDSQSKRWMYETREMAYDFEDGIDVYMRHLQHEPYKSTFISGLFRTSINKVKRLKAHHVMAGLIQEVKAQIIQAADRRERYQVDILPFMRNVVVDDPRLLALYADEAKLVGIDGPRVELIKLVDDEEKQLKVVSILGLGGLGKTTLANLVYEKIGQQFDCRAFVSLSQKPEMTKILQDILSLINKHWIPSTGSGDMEQLISALRDSLKDKRYLIVIDDIWSTQTWDTIHFGFPDNYCGSRIILTTRIASVAEFCCSTFHGLVYEARPLSKADSISLFLRRIFGSTDNCPPDLKKVSIGIIKKCDGLPLAIITMASLLANKSATIEEWIRVEKAIGLGRYENSSGVDMMRRILSLSYNDLPCHLKTCLLYLSIYPVDYEVQMFDLVWRWIAEGFIEPPRGRSSHEVGICYFNELINRSMILPVDIQYDGQAFACRVHYMIHDLIKSIAAEENFVISISAGADQFATRRKVRRLSVDYLSQETVTVSNRAVDHARSLSVFGYRKTMDPLYFFESMIDSLLNFQVLRLRVLVLESSMKLNNSDLENIPKLFLLRYLRIKARGLTRLPEEIGKCRFLETLDISHTDIKMLPGSIVELQLLKCLLVGGVKLPDGVGRMQVMEEMSNIYVDDSTSIKSLRELGSLTQLRSLGLEWCISGLDGDKQETFVSSIIKFGSNLKSLVLRSELQESFHFLWQYSLSQGPLLLQKLDLSRGPLFKFPVWMANLTNLTWLSIRVVTLRQETLNILGDLPALIFLELNAFAEDPKERLIVSNNRFQCLKVFHLNSVLSSAGLMFEAGAMPKLENLLLRAKAAAKSGVPDLVIGHLLVLALRNLSVDIYCHGARVEEVEALEAAIRNAATILPYGPKLCLSRLHEEEMIHDDPSGVEEANEEDTKQHDQVGRKIRPKRRRTRINKKR